MFEDISPSETISGKVDYRCFYLKNNSLASILYQAQIYVYYKVPSDVSINLGFFTSNERQIITITNNSPINGGYITIEHTNSNNQTYTADAYWDVNNIVWQNNIQTALNSIPGLEDVSVTLVEDQVFEVNFVGSSSNRYYQILSVSNNLLSSGFVTVFVNKSVSGGPINTTPDPIDVETTTPFGVVFQSSNSSYNIGNLRPGEYVPVWIKRTTPANATALESDGLTIRLIGSTTDG